MRIETERERYKELYGIENYLEEELFDIVIDTTDIPPEDIAQIIIFGCAEIVTCWLEMLDANNP